MTFLHKNKSKLILIFYLIVLAILFIFGLFFMTNYQSVHIAYKYDTDGVMSITERSSFTSETVTNEKLYRYFASATDLPEDLTNVKKNAFGTSAYATQIYDFNKQLNGYNEYIIVASIICLALCALFFVFSNNSRRIFYKSNLIVGILIPLVISVLSIVGIVFMISSISALNANLNLYRATSAMMSSSAGNYIEEALEDWNVVLANSTNVNSATFIFGIIIYIAVIAYSLFVSIFTIRKYKQTGKEREEIISRAVTAND
jgi:hypothetical protein